FMPTLMGRNLPHKKLLVRALMAVALILAPLDGQPRAAPQEDTGPPTQPHPKRAEDILIPIPFSPDGRSNACSRRQAPAADPSDELAAVPFWHLIAHAARGHAVRLTIDGPDKFAARIATLDDDMRRLALLFTLWDSMAWSGDGLPLFFQEKSGAIAA